MKNKLKPSPIQKELIKILTTSTGRHFLDSGGAYGRHWERNQHKDFMSSPVLTIEANQRNGEVDIIPTLSVFWFLGEYLDITEESRRLNTLFQKKLKTSDDGILDLIERFAASCDDGEGYNTFNNVTNTYNGDSMLSQTLQYNTFHTEEGNFIILQIHNGCDARSGYSTPQIFALTDGVDYFYLSQCDIGAGDGENTWYSDDEGYHFYANRGGLEFKEVAVCIDGAVYNKLTGKRITFWCDLGSEPGSDKFELTWLREIRDFVQSEYPNGGDLVQKTLFKFEEYAEVISLNIIVEEIIESIDNQTLKLEL